jgi:hypothetical protein
MQKCLCCVQLVGLAGYDELAHELIAIGAALSGAGDLWAVLLRSWVKGNHITCYQHRHSFLLGYTPLMIVEDLRFVVLLPKILEKGGLLPPLFFCLLFLHRLFHGAIFARRAGSALVFHENVVTAFHTF